MAGRVWAGVGQLLLAVAGLVLVIGWFVTALARFGAEIAGENEPGTYGWLGAAGTLTFVAAWLWALVTSLSLIRQAKANPVADPGSAPPPVIGSLPANRGALK